MRNSAFGLTPFSSHATSSSRVAIGVMSNWSRAMGFPAKRPRTLHAACAEGQCGGLRCRRIPGLSMTGRTARRSLTSGAVAIGAISCDGTGTGGPDRQEDRVAEIVGAFGVPHTPIYPSLVEREPDCDTARFFASLARELEAMRPDLLVMFDTDHLNTFFLDNLPIFAVGVTDAFKGPNDEPRAVPIYTIKSRADVASHIRRAGVAAGFDLTLAQQFSVDHSVVVPLHFMTPNMQIPVIPIFVSGHVAPLPSARRCLDLGAIVRRAIESFPEKLRVAVM